MDITIGTSRSTTNLYFSNGIISTSGSGLSISKISISSIQIDPIKRIATFTIIFWASNGDTFISLGQKTYTCNSTYTLPVTTTIFDVSSTPSIYQLYIITVSDSNNKILFTFNSQFPYYSTNSNLFIYYRTNAPHNFTGPTGSGYTIPGYFPTLLDKYTASTNAKSIDLWYTVNNIQYLKKNVKNTNLQSSGNITAFYSTSAQGLTGGLPTTDPMHPYAFPMTTVYNVRTQLQSQSSYTISRQIDGQLNNIQMSSTTLPCIGVTGLNYYMNDPKFYNQQMIGPTGGTGTYTSGNFLYYTLYTGYTGYEYIGGTGITGYYYTGYSGTTGYQINNLQYTMQDLPDTTIFISSVIVTDISDPTTTIQYGSNPLNSTDVGIIDSGSADMYTSILSLGDKGSVSIKTLLDNSLQLSSTSTISIDNKGVITATL